MNLNISVDQLQGVLAEEHVAAVAKRLGISQQDAAASGLCSTASWYREKARFSASCRAGYQPAAAFQGGSSLIQENNLRTAGRL
jgi:hypothetical protein